MGTEESSLPDTFSEFAAEAPIGIMRADAEGMCIYANPAWFALTGLSRDETVGYAWSSAVHPEDMERTMAAWMESVATGRPYVNELRLVNKNGSVKRVIAHAKATRDEGGVITGYIGTVMDITTLHESQQLLRRLIEVQEEERRALCHDFHDGLIQYAIAAQMLLEAHASRCRPTGASAEIAEAIRYLNKGVLEARRLIRGIRSAVLDDLGLAAAIDDLAEQLAEFGIRVEKHVDPRVETEPLAKRTAVYRVVQEALTNVRKHSGDRQPCITINYDEGVLQVVVEDRGKGFDVVSSSGRGFGIAGMTERVRLAGGICRVESRPGHGTRVIVRLDS